MTCTRACRRSLATLSLLLLSLSAGCSVDIRPTTPASVPRGNSFDASATTERNGTAPTGGTLTYTHQRDADGTVSPQQNAAVTSAGDSHTATMSAPAGTTFAPFDRVNLRWRVTFHSWGQSSGRSKEEIVLIDPGMQVTLSPSEITAGQNATGVVEIPAHSAETVVQLEVTDQPLYAEVKLEPSIVVIPAGSTASSPLQLKADPVENQGGGVVLPGVNLSRCEVTATVQLPNGDTFKAADTISVRRQQD